jgi:hypothetical protein
MAFHSEEGNIHLERRIPQKPQKLDLRVYGGRHKIDDAHFERPYILMRRPVIGYDKDPLVAQGVIGR